MKKIYVKKFNKEIFLTEGLSDFLVDKLKDLIGIDTFNKLKKDLGFGEPIPSKKLSIEIPKNLESEYRFAKIPDGKNNYRSAQMPADVLSSVIKKFNIENVIRLNGDGRDSYHSDPKKGLSVNDEKIVCESLGCKFESISSHKGYVRNKGYVVSVDEVSKILQKGNTLIHCAHGADRTGGMVGGYLKKNNVMVDLDELWKYTTKYNGWQRMIDRCGFFGTGYDKYADCFFPINKLIEKRPKSCPSLNK